MKILEGNQVLTRNQPRFVEVGDKILMNGAVYELSDFTPVPYNWCEIDCIAREGNIIPFTENFMVNYDTRNSNATYKVYSDPYYLNGGVYDNNDETIYYKATETNSASTNADTTTLTKLKIVDGKVSKVRHINLSINNVQILGQTEEYLFVVGYKPESSTVNYSTPNMAARYGVINKETFAYADILNSGNAHTVCNAVGPVKLLRETSNFIILIHSTNAYTNNSSDSYICNNGDITIIRIDKVSRTMSRFKTSPFNSINSINVSVSAVNEYDNFLMRDISRYMVYNALYDKESHSIKLFYNLINIGDTFIHTDLLHEHREEAEIDWNGADDETIERFVTPRVPYSVYYSHTLRYRFVYNKCVDTSYLTVILYQTHINITSRDKYTTTCAYTFSVNAYGSLRFEAYTDLPSNITAFMSLDDEGKRMYGIDTSNLYYIEFNEIKKKLEVVSTNNLSPTAVGMDSAGRTWVISTNADIHMFNENVSSKISVAFKDAVYDYTGSDIDTGLIVNCSNVFGTKISSELELEIRGNAYFKLTGSKKVRVTTLPLTDTEISLVINGPGQLSVIPKVIL